MPEPILATPVEPSALAQAERAIELAVSSPRRARAAAERALQQARATRDHEAAVLAERALGLAALELKEGAAAVAHLRRAVKIALGASLDVRTAEARMSLGRALLHAGNSRGAFRELELADSTLSGIAAARLQFQRATLFHHHHRLEEALAGYRSALGAFRRAGDRLWEARALNNRGLIQAERGSLPAAEADLIAAAELYSTLELDMALADVEHNLGWVAARRGDVPAALDWYDRSQDRRRSHGVPIANGLSDRCELLLSVRLVAEARSSAERAVAELASGRMASETAEARLMLAEAALLDGDRETARGTGGDGVPQLRAPGEAALGLARPLHGTSCLAARRHGIARTASRRQPLRRRTRRGGVDRSRARRPDPERAAGARARPDQGRPRDTGADPGERPRARRAPRARKARERAARSRRRPSPRGLCRAPGGHAPPRRASHDPRRDRAPRPSQRPG